MSQTHTEELELAPEQPGEPAMKQLAPYDEFKTKIESLKKTAETITVTDISQTSEMKIARTTRLALKDIRIAIEHRHKELKEDVLREGRKIDAGKNELLEVLKPLELRLKDQEEFIERETARIQAEKRVARLAEITPFLSGPPAIDLGVVRDESYASMLQDAKDAHAARTAREQREKEEAEAKAKAEAEERERIRAENERMKAEALEKERLAEIERARVAKEKAEAEAALKAEREAAEKKLREEREQARREQEAAQAKALAEREAAEAKLREERAKADRERKAAEEKARKEREAIESKARAEKAEAEAAARKEREAAAAENARLAKIAEQERQKAATAARVAREAKELQEMQEARRLAKEEAEKQRIADEAARAAKAPDKEKLLAFAERIRTLQIPEFATEAADEIGAKLNGNLMKLVSWIEAQVNAL